MIMTGFDLSTISNAYIGGTQASAIYLGSNQIWPSHDYSEDVLTIESLENSNPIYFMTDDASNTKTISCSTDLSSWSSKTSSTGGALLGTLNAGDKLYLLGYNTSYKDQYFTSSKNVNIYGNIMSLISGSNFIGETTLTSSYTFYCMFADRSRNHLHINDASNLILPATTLTSYCYAGMFGNNTSLIKAPKLLPAMTLADSCYKEMFIGNTSLIKAPALPATSLASECYYSMFRNCYALITPPPSIGGTSTTMPYMSCFWMFGKCSSLTKAPALLAPTLGINCYQEMFEECTSLTHIECHATDISAYGCLASWLFVASATGTFYKDANTQYPSGASGIPSGWTVVNF